MTKLVLYKYNVHIFLVIIELLNNKILLRKIKKTIMI